MITEGYLLRHCQGRSGGRGPAIIDIAQDHLLYLDAVELRFASCSRGDEWDVRQAIEQLMTEA